MVYSLVDIVVTVTVWWKPMVVRNRIILDTIYIASIVQMVEACG